MRSALLLTGGALLCAACAAPGRPIPAQDPRMDVHSHARPHEVRVRHVDLDLELDFAAQIVRGSATLALERTVPGAGLVLDTKGLTIERVAGADGAPRAHRLGAADPILGSPLAVTLAPGDTDVTIHYRTGPGAEALQWLAPAQTGGGRHPFLFSQGQAILTRTWIPVQDSPGVRITYSARVRAPSALRVVMSAVHADEGPARDAATREWRFRMPHPIPPYLIAIACGDLEFRALSARCGVYAEPGTVDRAAAELSDTEAMVQAAEALFGPYRWGRYDLLVLPPSFPFGGMENPCLTFATPTILAGDKSLVALVAHELAHSWSGNLVTNATWRDFWLNEGFTVYFEHRIMARVYGEERAAMEQSIGLTHLEEELRTLKPEDQVLHIDLAGRNPDDAMTAVAYDKGAAFLHRLEQVFGRATFDAFLTRYFDAHAFRSITTDEFLAWLRHELLDRDPTRARAIDVDAWVRRPGLPADTVRPRSRAFAQVDAVVAKLAQGEDPVAGDAHGWVTHQWLHFLEHLPPGVDAAGMARLDGVFGFTGSGNSEILAKWLELAVRRGYAGADARLEDFLLHVGRRKFLKPIYEAMAATEAGRVRARAIYARARPRYHAVTVRTLDQIVLGTAG
ncbi:MAG: leukotriene A4 hydrolase C-terminal domain-containing protein [Planctomycetes bacterium]|nr:leukotriene A4 hydrolase C-terminal domain-containing protein [Planctomycetota bacterium]